MATLGEYLGAGSSTTKLLLHLNGNSTDSSGNGNNGSDTAITYSQANGRFGQGARFNAAYPSKILKTDFNQGTLSSFTISLMVNFSNTSRGDILNIRNSSNSTDIQLMSNQNRGSASAGYITANAYNGPAHNAASISNGWNDGKWHNVVVTFSGSTLYLYINGRLQSSVGAGQAAYDFTKLEIGYDSVNNVNGYTGSVDEVIIENIAWSAEKVKKYYTMAKGRFGIL